MSKTMLHKHRLCLLFGLTAAFLGSQGSAATIFPIATNSSTVEFAGGVAFDGTNYLAGLVSGANVVGQRFSGTGELVGTPLLAGANPGFPPAVAMAGARTNCLVVWSDHSISSGVTVLGQLFSPSGGKIGASFPVLANRGSHGFQVAQAAASDGTNFLVVWRDANGSSFYGQLVTGSGTLQGSEFLLFTTSDEVGDRNLAVTFGKTNYLVAWQTEGNDDTQARGVIVSPNGAVGSVFQISQTASLDYDPLAAAFDGTNYLVVWSRSTESGGSGPPVWDLRGRFVSQAGSPVGSELLLAAEQATFPALAFDGVNYLAAWGYNVATTNADATIHARYLDRAGKPTGPVFVPFSAQGTNPPLLPLSGLAFDGNRYVLAATFGAFVVDSSGDILGFSGGDVYGKFIPRSTTPPYFTNAALVDNQLRGELWVVPGQVYSIELSTNLVDWTPVATLSSEDTELLAIADTVNLTEVRSLFYRAVLGNTVGVSYQLSFIEFANAGGFGGGLTASPSFPVSLNSYAAILDAEYDVNPPAATNVFFTGPAGSGLSHVAADPENSGTDEEGGWYQSPFVSSPAVAPGGTWTVDYGGETLTFDIPDPQAAARLVVPVPTVTVSGDVMQGVSWTYRNAATGAAIGAAPAYLMWIQVQIEGVVGGRLYNSPTLGPGVTSHALTAPVNWSNVSGIHLAYDDSLDNHYVVYFSKP